MTLLNKLKGYRTFALAVVTAVLGVLTGTDVINPEISGPIITFLGVVAFLLRFGTNTAPGKSA